VGLADRRTEAHHGTGLLLPAGAGENRGGEAEPANKQGGPAHRVTQKHSRQGRLPKTIMAGAVWGSTVSPLDSGRCAWLQPRAGGSAPRELPDMCGYARTQRWRLQLLSASTPNTSTNMARITVLACASWNRLRLT